MWTSLIPFLHYTTQLVSSLNIRDCQISVLGLSQMKRLSEYQQEKQRMVSKTKRTQQFHYGSPEALWFTNISVIKPNSLLYRIQHSVCTHQLVEEFLVSFLFSRSFRCFNGSSYLKGPLGLQR